MGCLIPPGAMEGDKDIADFLDGEAWQANRRTFDIIDDGLDLFQLAFKGLDQHLQVNDLKTLGQERGLLPVEGALWYIVGS